jgi:hypothetical protein
MFSQTYSIEARCRRIERSDEQDQVQLEAGPRPWVQWGCSDGLVEVRVTLDLFNLARGWLDVIDIVLLAARGVRHLYPACVPCFYHYVR